MLSLPITCMLLLIVGRRSEPKQVTVEKSKSDSELSSSTAAKGIEFDLRHVNPAADHRNHVPLFASTPL